MPRASTKYDRATLTRLFSDVPRELKPRRDLTVTRELIQRVQKAPALDVLPNVMYPKPNQCTKPPIMYYGFTYPEDILMRYAEDHNCVLICNTVVDLALTEEPEMIVPEVDRTGSCLAAFDRIITGLLLDHKHRGPTVEMAINNRQNVAGLTVVLYSNYDPQDAMSSKEVAKVVDFFAALGADISLKWYVSSERIFWWPKWQFKIL